jgi:hypothetical protein
MRNVGEVRCARDAGEDVAPLYSCLLEIIRLLVTAVDAFLNRESAAVRPPNLTQRLPDNDDQKNFIFRQRYAAAMLCTVSSLGLSVGRPWLMQHRKR